MFLLVLIRHEGVMVGMKKDSYVGDCTQLGALWKRFDISGIVLLVLSITHIKSNNSINS